ncbi:MAG TPA: rRNA maturation RNase YbeY [Bryobacteraceae bacterium]
MPSDDTPILFRHPWRTIRRRALGEFWSDVARRVGKGRAGACVIASDREMRALNRRFRAKNYAPDVLSFPAVHGAAGEIAISFDRARSQALARGHSVEDELRILMLHGVLHLAGMDHETDSGEMARAEARWRKKLSLPRGLVERSRV